MKRPDVLVALELRAPAGVFAPQLYAAPTGSAYTCHPPVEDTDEDWIVHTQSGIGFGIEVELSLAGYERSEGQEDYGDCMSYRKGKVNIIVVYHLEMYHLWRKATEVCKALNLSDKADRKRVHRILCNEEPVSYNP